MSFHCSGKKAGEVDMTLKLNYTRVESWMVDTEDVKSFMVVVRRECLKTGMLTSRPCFLLLFLGRNTSVFLSSLLEGRRGTSIFLSMKSLIFKTLDYVLQF